MVFAGCFRVDRAVQAPARPAPEALERRVETEVGQCARLLLARQAVQDGHVDQQRRQARQAVAPRLARAQAVEQHRPAAGHLVEAAIAAGRPAAAPFPWRARSWWQRRRSASTGPRWPRLRPQALRRLVGHDRADAGAAHEVDFDAVFAQCAVDPQVREAACATTGEHQADRVARLDARQPRHVRAVASTPVDVVADRQQRHRHRPVHPRPVALGAQALGDLPRPRQREP